MERLRNGDTAKAQQLLAMCIFGTIGIFVRWIPLPSAVIAMARGIIGVIFLLLVVVSKRLHIASADIRRNLPLLCVSGAFLGLNWILLFEAYRYTTVATATLCYYLAPVIVTLASPFVLHERLTLQKALCVAAALLGMVFVSGVLQTGAGGSLSMKGVCFGVGAAVFYACIVFINKKLVHISAFDTTIMQLGISSVVLLPYVLLIERAGTSVTAVTLSTIALLLTVGILHTGVAYALYFGSIQKLPAQTVALFSFIDPIVAILLSALLLKERMDLFSVIGAVLVLGSTLLSEMLEIHGAGRAEEKAIPATKKPGS